MAVEQQSDILEDRVQSFTAQHLGVKRSKLSTATRLNRDLGMDGDDAVEFFKDFAAEFQVNLDDLYARWDQHFGPEGGLVRTPANDSCGPLPLNYNSP